MNILQDYSDILEQTSIDEAYLDCSNKIHALTIHKDQAIDADDSSLTTRPSKIESNAINNLSYSHLIEDFAISIKIR